MSKSTVGLQFEVIERLIREGKGGDVRPQIRQWCERAPKRELRSQLGQFAWRVGLPELGVRLLHPLVRPPPRSTCVALPEEIAEYANCLARMGAVREAEELLSRVPAGEIPSALLYRAFCCFARWDYQAAIPWLKRYLQSRVGPYQRLVGKLNLAAALVFERSHLASEALLSELIRETSLRKLPVLHGNTLELAAQSALARRQWRQAEKFLSLSAAALTDKESLAAFFVRKWQAVLDLSRKGGAGSLSQLHGIREEAVRRRHWESVRSCDECEVRVTGDARRFAYLYYGTPYESFRKRVIGDFPGEPFVPESYLWRGDEKQAARVVVDLSEGSIGGKRVSLKIGHNHHRLIAALLRDFYRPCSTAELHARLYPDELYHLVSSPGRLYQAVRAFRRWAEGAGIPLEVLWQEGSYRLRARPGCGVSLRLSAPGDEKSKILRKLEERWPAESFSMSQASSCVGVAPRTLLRALSDAVHQGMLTRTGKNRHARYHFVSVPSKR